MTKDQMNRIIAEALRSYGWLDTNCPLPVYIANAIADALPMPHPNHHDDNPVIIALRDKLDFAEKEVIYLRNEGHAKEQHKAALRDEIDRLKSSINEWKESFGSQKEGYRKLSSDLEREKASNLDLKSKLEELTGVADEFEKENQTLRNDRDVAMRKLEEARAAQRMAEREVTRLAGANAHFKKIANDASGERMTALQHWKARAEKAEAEIDKLKSSINEWKESFEFQKQQLEQARAAQPHFYNPSGDGECSICGSGQFAPQHDVAQWKARAEKAEMNLQDAHQMHDHERDLRRDADTEAEHLRARAERAEKRADDNWNLKEAAVLRSVVFEEQANKFEATIATIRKMLP